MRLLMIFVCGVLVVSLSGAALGQEFAEHWVYGGGNVADAEGLAQVMTLLEQAKAAGGTHIVFNESSLARLDEMNATYFENAGKAQARAKELGLILVPGIYNVGYSGRYLRKDANLAAGVPVRKAPFTATGGKLVPDATDAPKIANGGFEESSAGHRLAGWTTQEYPGVSSFVDKEVKHSGAASLKVTANNSVVRVGQSFDVRPFQCYRFSVWVKSQGIQAEGEDYELFMSSDAKRRLTYTNLQVEETQDWKLHQITFNTFESTRVDMSVGISDARAGTIWFDDLAIEPAGLVNVIRRETAPLVVTSADEEVAFVEGRDFAPVPGASSSMEFYIPAGVTKEITLTPKSRIKEGEKLLVSFFYSTLIYSDQAVCSTQDPGILAVMEDQMKRVAEAWPSQGYFMNYDEIRIGGWEVQPAGENLTPGQMLARHVKTGIGYIKKYAPGAKIYVWSDMFDPTHNARPFETRKMYYYLVNGNWDGAWEGLGSDVIICNWNGTANAAASLKWFAGRGHKQFVAGYYDGDPKENIDRWLDASAGVPNIIGMMYTTWRGDYSRLGEFFKVLDEETRLRKSAE